MNNSSKELDYKVRMAAFNWLSEQASLYDDVLPRELLLRGFKFEDEMVSLLSPAGIFKPKILPEIPLSITTTVSGPYNDHFGSDGLLQYRYRGSDSQHRDNRGLREAMKKGIPLIYFHGIVPGKYAAVWPVYIVGDDQDALVFRVAADDQSFIQPRLQFSTAPAAFVSESRREYITSLTRVRLHQRTFRERVLRAYRTQCACCRLRHLELLDAAHIVPDSQPEGEPRVPNGIALCKLHHAAFDANIFGIRPDYFVEVRKDVLREEDGPMLLHGLQELNGKKIILPSASVLKPDPSLLEKRFEQFRAA